MSLSVPKLRFPEFQEEWEKKKVSDIAYTIDGDRSSKYPNEKDLVEEGIIFLSTSNIINNKLSFKNRRFITEKKFKELKKGHLEQNDLIVTLRGSIGIIVEFKNNTYNEGFINAQMMIIRLNNSTPTVFFYNWYLTQGTQNYLMKISSGSAQPQLTKSNIKNLEIKLPLLQEQQKIVSFLSKVDEKIEKLEKKHKLWKTYKKGIVQQLFTQKLMFINENGQNYPNWQDKALGEILFKILDFRGKTPKKIGMEWGGYIPALSANNVEMGQINLNKETKYGSEGLYKKWMNKGDCELGDIVITMEAPLGNIAQIPDDKKYLLSQRVVLLKVNKKYVVKKYLAQYLSSNLFQSQLIRYASGSTAKGIQQSNLIKLIIRTPKSKNEQDKIASFLSTIDKKIFLIKKELDINKEFKMGLLQHMFC